MKSKTITCYNCQSDRSIPYDSENGFTLVKCLDCGLLYVNPRPSEEEITMATMSGIHRGDVNINVTGSFNQDGVRRFLKILNNFYDATAFSRDDLTWLDIGCGHGEFMKALQIHSQGKVKVKGSEPNGEKIKSARNQGLDVSFIDLDEHEQQYDFVSLLNVYSHLPNPVETLKGWKKLIKPGGELLLETGHSCHLDAKIHHKPYYLPDHLSFANKEIVIDILHKLGFEIVKVDIYRLSLYPSFQLKSILKELVKVVLMRQTPKSSLNNFFPQEPNRDMWIRAKLVN